MTPQAPHTTEAPSLVANTAEEKLHTPLPWRVDIHTLTISAADGNVGLLNLARKEDESRANAVLIVDRVNSFDALTEANKKLREALDVVQGPLVAIRNHALVSFYGPNIEYVQKEVATAFNVIEAALKSTGAK
jgi:hypothetical protein